ncbi:hypothetical protein Sango_0415400 [Sesamum angolense]|uniref:Cysteine proteinase inhibitor n=1 Tax=Sesamum angolense TaxID=2727404 RepID=A0AAE1XBA6_9LAMI|nr:hypothetical protein Sango_0415200 [Sesamum angolense]KAK4408344.1 hypothetical protein Sango_0415400 [Sesamum angolense]
MVKTGAPVPVEVTPEIIALGRFAVDEHNKKQHTCLEFKKVWSAERQLVNGYNYYLTLEAANEGKHNLYEATVYVSWENNAKELTEFKIIRPTPGGAYPIDVTPKEVEGFNYYLTLEAADGGKNNVYAAKVFVSLKDEKELEGFTLVAPV